MSQIKLTYFNLRGRGELIRLVLHASGVKFEDNRIDPATWPELKPKIKFGQLPLIEIDGVVANQSVAIAHSFAVKHGLAGDTDLDHLRCQAHALTLRDIGVPVIHNWVAEKDPAKKAELVKSYVEPEGRKVMSLFETELDKCPSKSGHLVAGKLTYADLELFCVLNFLVDHVGDSILSDFPLLSKLYETITQHPKLKPYLESRPKSAY